MKKIYSSPSIKVRKMASRHLLSGSNLGVSETNYNGSTTIESRDISFDDEEDW